MIVLDGSQLTTEIVERIAVAEEPIALSETALARVAANRQGLESAIARDDPIYGVTTGLGAFLDRSIGTGDAAGLQRAVLRSHAAGVGSHLTHAEVRAALAVRLNCLMLGFSGIRPLVLERIALLLNKRITPAVPATGSVGASGDLVPSAHAFLLLVGEGQILAPDGRILDAGRELRALGIEPLELASKEALALINGTHFMAGLGALHVQRARRFIDTADGIAALTLEATYGSAGAFDARVHALRPLAGQAETAALVRSLVRGSQRIGSSDRVQDAYSVRCVPQVHGTFREALRFVEGTVATDLNAVTDNPIVFNDPIEVVSAGNFHGQSLALSFDLLRIALADIASISERRTFRLLSPSLNGDLPPFLTENPGRENGYMLTQITAAAVISELRALAHPVSHDNVPTSDNQEDHVSMGMTGALLSGQSLARAETVVAIEALCAAQAIDLTDGRPGTGCEQMLLAIRERVAPLSEDRPPAPDIEALRELVAAGDLQPSSLLAAAGRPATR